MIRLQAFGGFDLRGDEGHELYSVPAQPRRQALLLYLALAHPRGFHRRDTLISLVWPEDDDARARASLSRVIHYLRSSLGSDVVLSRGNEEVGLDWTRFWCDAAGFENALDRNELAEGMALYQGDLLPGFHIDEGEEFEQWLEGERTRLRLRAVQATRLLSERAEQAGENADAVLWARRALSFAPFDETAVRRLISVLDRTGDRAGALNEFEEFTQRLHRELAAKPSAETAALADAIRARDYVVTVPPQGARVVEPAPPAPREAVGRQAEHTDHRVRRVSLWAGAVVLALVAVIGLLASRTRTRATERAATVVVMPFEGSGAADNAIASRIVTLLGKRLDQSGELHTVNSQFAKSRFLVSGRLTAHSDTLTIHADLFDSTHTQIVAAETSGSSADLNALADDLGWQLLAANPSRGKPVKFDRITPPTQSLDALAHAQKAEQLYSQGKYKEATSEYREATRADSTFASAYLWMSRAANWTGDWNTTEWAQDRARRFITNLSLLDQFRVRSWDAYQHGQADAVERYSRFLIANDPNSADPWLMLGETRFHWGPLIGRTPDDARTAFDNALSITGHEAGSIIHLARIAAAQNRTAALDSLVERAQGTQADEEQRTELDGLRAFTAGDRAAQQRVAQAISRFDDANAQAIATSIVVAAVQHGDARNLGRALYGQQRPPRLRSIGAVLEAQSTIAHGEWRAADHFLATSPNLGPARALEYRAALALLPFNPRPPAELRDLRAAIERFPAKTLTHYSHLDALDIAACRRSWLLGMLSLELGERARVQAMIDSLGHDTNVLSQRVARQLAGELYHSDGKAAEALRALGTPSILPDSLLPGVMEYPGAAERFLRAELYHQLGNDHEALRWYNTFPDPGGYDLMYLAPAHTRKAEIYDRLHDPVSAREEAAQAHMLWQKADAEILQWPPFHDRT